MPLCLAVNGKVRVLVAPQPGEAFDKKTRCVGQFWHALPSEEKRMRYEDTAYIEYGNVKISNIGYRNARNVLIKTIQDNERGYICLNDVGNIYAAIKDEELRSAINGSLLSLADGVPLAWYGWMVGCKEIERISGAALMEGLLTDLTGYRHYLLGDTEQTIAKVISKAKELNRGIDITGYSPPFKEFTEEDNRLIMERVRKAGPDIVWVSFGGKKQEKWMSLNVSKLDRGVMIGVGAAFKWLIGELVAPPPIFQKTGMQFIFRMAQEFYKNPGRWLAYNHKREIMKSRMVFITNLPQEVLRARKQLKGSPK